MSKGIESYNDTLLEICSDRQVECINLASRLEKDTTVFYDDCHFNESGARKVSEVLSNSLLSQRLKMSGSDALIKNGDPKIFNDEISVSSFVYDLNEAKSILSDVSKGDD